MASPGAGEGEASGPMNHEEAGVWFVNQQPEHNADICKPSGCDMGSSHHPSSSVLSLPGTARAALLWVGVLHALALLAA